MDAEPKNPKNQIESAKLAALDFVRRMARAAVVGECQACHKVANVLNPECNEHAPFEYTDEWAEEILDEWILTARDIVKKMDKFPTDEKMVETARRLRGRDGELEIDDDARVSRDPTNPDHGAYVQAWVWVDDEDAESTGE